MKRMWKWFLAYFRLSESAVWKTMDSAPRDGTEIEIRCTYGFEPWIARARWTTNRWGPVWSFGNDTFIDDCNEGPRSEGANNSNLSWRRP